jgi:hypothetical protein
MTETVTPAATAGATATAAPLATMTATPSGPVPRLGRVFLIVLENREFTQVIGNPSAPDINRWTSEGALLTGYFGVAHPSLPNYLALTAGDTFGVHTDCEGCTQSATNLADQIEASGRTWRAYIDGMPSACFTRDVGTYAVRHNPFVYFDDVRLDPARCQDKVVPFTQLAADLREGALPDFVWITPDLCHSGHDCAMPRVDRWLREVVGSIRSSNSYQANSLLVLTWDEGTSSAGCCGKPGGGRVVTLLLSPLVVPGSTDDTPLTHYSLVATIETGWGLPRLAKAADPSTALIEDIWR